MKNTLLILLLATLLSPALLAQGWIKHFDSYISNTLGENHSIKTLDNQFFLAGIDNNIDILLTKTNAVGDTLWTYKQANGFTEHVIGAVQLPSDSSYLIVHNRYIPSSGASQNYLLNISSTGQFLSSNLTTVSTRLSIGSIKTKLVVTPEEDILICSTKDATSNQPSISLAKVNRQGAVIWDRSYSLPTGEEYYASDIALLQDGNYMIAGRRQYNGTGIGLYNDNVLLKTDTAGTELSRHILPAFTPNSTRASNNDILVTNDGNLLLTGKEEGGNPSNYTTIQKLDTAGNVIWRWSETYTAALNSVPYMQQTIELSDGNFMSVGYVDDHMSTIYRSWVYLIKFSPTGQILLEKKIEPGRFYNYTGLEIYQNTPQSSSGFTIFGEHQNGSCLIFVDSNANIYTNSIQGHYYQDLNNNCLKEANEPAVPYQLVAAIGTNQDYHASTDAMGWYDLKTDTGMFTVNPITISPYWQACQNQTTVQFTGFNQKDTVDIALQPIDSCAHLKVDLSAPFLRRCFPSTYTVHYQNLGTIAAPTAYVEVNLDPYLTYTSSSIPLIQQSGTLHRFDVGSVAALGNGSFTIEVLVDCDSTSLGQVHCSEAHIFPDSLCAGNTWTGPIIQASAYCTTDSITFRLYNAGGGMALPQNYVIIEEHVMIHQGPFQLGSGMDTLITVPIQRGKFYRIEANQDSGFPSYLGNHVATANNLRCGGLSLLNSPDILGQYYNDNISPFVAVDCQPNIGAYDPNDKQAQPQGYQANHYITNTIPLNYHIRFQNTGTDTAFTVVVIDTLDTNLNPSSLQMGASSHSYTWQLANNILTVRFDNIMLPDSNVNEPLSHGFFKFKIEQQPNLADGTMLYNQAGIYFDFNPPIITNQVFHTIGSNFIIVPSINVDYLEEEPLEVRVYPNPFSQQATFEVVGGEEYQQLELQLFSATGQLVQHYQSNNSNSLTINRNNLPAGIYFYQLIGDQQALSTGKVILK